MTSKGAPPDEGDATEARTEGEQLVSDGVARGDGVEPHHAGVAVDNVMNAFETAASAVTGALSSAAKAIDGDKGSESSEREAAPAAAPDAAPAAPAAAAGVTPAPPQQEPPASPPASPAAATSEHVAPAPQRSLLSEIGAGLSMVRAGRFHAPLSNARVRRFFYPLSILVALWNATMENDELRRRYFRVMVPQAVLVLACGLFWVFVINEVNMNLDFNIEAKGKNVTITDVAKTGERAALSIWTALLALYTTASVFEWIIIALTRQHHDALSFHVSNAVGVPPEERIDDPRVRVDVQWMVTKMKRRIQGGVILLVSAVPAVVIVLIVLLPLLSAIEDAFSSVSVVEPALNVVANAVPNVVLALVGAYWLGVFTLGKTAHAWRDEIVSDPFFLRAFDRWADRFPRLLGWLHLYARILRRALGLVRRPAYVVEHATWESVGFIAMRVLISPPGLYVLLRPLIPVAATVVIAARSPDTLRGLPVSIVLQERGQ